VRGGHAGTQLREPCPHIPPFRSLVETAESCATGFVTVLAAFAGLWTGYVDAVHQRPGRSVCTSVSLRLAIMLSIPVGELSRLGVPSQAVIPTRLAELT
jgi:hypothetical protein